MQNVQNAAEIQQRVINLVELYRTKVGKESQIAKDAKEEKAYWDDVNLDAAIQLHEDGMKGPIGIDLSPDMPEEWVKTLQVNYHLLGHFYSVVAGNKANEKVLEHFLPEFYDSTFFSEEEETFLQSHFKELVNYIIQTPSDDLENVNRYDRKETFLIPEEVLKLIGEHVVIPQGSIIYNPFACFAQFPNIFKGCKFYCEATYGKNKKLDDTWTWAWMEIALYANNVKSEIIENDVVPQSNDAALAFIPILPKSYKPVKIVIDDEGHTKDSEISDGYDSACLSKIYKMYENLKKGGKMVLITRSDFFWNKDGDSPLKPLWKKLIMDKAIVEIIQLPSVMGDLLPRDYSVLIAEKSDCNKHTTLIDARFAIMESASKTFREKLDLEALNTMINNHGKDLNTGLRKMVIIPTSELKAELLLPQIYVIDRPMEGEHPVLLSNYCSLSTKSIDEIDFDLPFDTPWVALSDLSEIYHGPLDITKVEKAECPNNPPHTDDFVFSKSGKFADHRYAQRTSIGHRVWSYRQSFFADGKTDVIPFYLCKEGIKTSLIPKVGKPIASRANILCPKEGVDSLSLLALIHMPIVYRQMQAYQEFGLSNHLNDIYIPTDTRIVHDEKQRLLNEQEMYKVQEEKLAIKKTEYINEVRMRKHDMGQYIFELTNIEDLMRYYIENRNTEKNFCQEIEKLLDNFRSSLSELSLLLDNLSKEEQFGEPESFNIDEFLSQLKTRHKADGFNIEYNCDKKSIENYYHKNHAEDNFDLGHLDDGDTLDLGRLADGDTLDLSHLDDGDTLDLGRLDDGDTLDLSHLDDGDTLDLGRLDEGDTLDLSHLDDGKNYDMDRHNEANFLPTDIIGNSISFSKENMDIPYIYVARNDFQRMVNNILDNARIHGFTDSNRKDYRIKVRLSIDNEKKMFQIDFLNNGNPLPEGMNKMRYGIKGEKAGKNAGTGIGGNYVKSFVEHYGGDYDIFMENGWTVVRICLPIK